jgi:hypothetical protein
MHGEHLIAQINTSGYCRVYKPDFMPYSLYLDDSDTEIDTLINNITNFYYWCASRTLPLDRQYRKAILNSIGASQAVTDKDRALIALSYHCLSLTDIYWVKEESETISFEHINLYDHSLNEALIPISLRGKQISVQNEELASDLSTNGCYPKAWIRKNDGFYLLKDGDLLFVENELLASKICRCFDCRQVFYEKSYFESQPVTSCKIITNKNYSIVSREAFDIYACNAEIDPMSYILKLDSYSYYMMNILDYLIGNTDRHWGNWGLLIDNSTNQPIRLHSLMDFNQAFQSYDTIDGAICQTVRPKIINQREAAILAIKEIGLNQIQEINPDWFANRRSDYEMFQKRLNILKEMDEN